MATENRIIENAAVIIKDKKILSINGPVPDKAKLINGKGKWLNREVLILGTAHYCDIGRRIKG